MACIHDVSILSSFINNLIHCRFFTFMLKDLLVAWHDLCACDES